MITMVAKIVEVGQSGKSFRFVTNHNKYRMMQYYLRNLKFIRAFYTFCWPCSIEENRRSFRSTFKFKYYLFFDRNEYTKGFEEDNSPDLGTADNNMEYTNHREKRAGNSRLVFNLLFLYTYLFKLLKTIVMIFSRNYIVSTFCQFSTTAINPKWQERETSLRSRSSLFSTCAPCLWSNWCDSFYT